MNEIITKKIEEAVANGMSPGCSLVILRNGTLQVNYSCGYFSDSNTDLVSYDTLFDLASITKLYTTALILRAEEIGLLAIQDRVSKYLPVFHESELTIIDLLTHRANFGLRLSDFRSEYQNNFGANIFEVIPPSKASPDVHYENITFLFLGRIIEQVYKQPLHKIFSEFFTDLNLDHTKLGLKNQKEFISPPTEIKSDCIVQNSTHDESADLLGGIAGNAGVFASAADLAKFGNLWIEGKIIPKEKLKKVFMDYAQAGARSQGLGWHQDLYGQSTKNQGIYLHTGFTGGLLAIHPLSSLVCAFTCNRTYYGRDNLKHREMLKFLVDNITK